MKLYLPLLLTIGGNILYHVAQKLVPKTANPLTTMMAAYAVAFVVCAVAAFVYPSQKPLLESFTEFHWTVVSIGVGIAAIEVGFLLVYRAGWNVSIAPLLTSVALSVMLVPIGLLAFREQLSAWNIAGIIFCILGMILVSKK